MKFRAKKDGTLLEMLTSEGGYSTATKARQIIKNGAVWLNGKIEKIPSLPVTAGSEVEINAARSKQEAAHEKYLFRVVFEDEFLFAAVKPPAMSVNKGKAGKPGFRDIVLAAMLKEKKDIQQIFSLYSVENNATGIVLFAKNQKTAVKMQGEPITMTWACLLEGRLKDNSGVIALPLVATSSGKVIAVEKATKLSQDAETIFRVRKPAGKFTIVEASAVKMLPKQFQAHFQAIGNPVAGEKRYGATLPFKGRNGLHLEKITFKHPVTGVEMKLNSNLPQTFTRAGRYL